VGAGHTKQRRDLGGTEAGGAGSTTVQSAGVTGGPSEAALVSAARQGRAGGRGDIHGTGLGEHKANKIDRSIYLSIYLSKANKVSRAPERFGWRCRLGCGVGVAVHRLGGGTGRMAAHAG
jgi:hypothetical protein